MTTQPTNAPEPLGAYAFARRSGHLLFLSGQGPRKRGERGVPGVVVDSAGKVVSYDIEAQVRSCFENVRVVLEEAGSSWEKIIDVQVFLVNLERDFAVYNRVYAEYFPPSRPLPTRTTVGVTALPQGAGAPIHFEVKVVAEA